MNSKCSTNSLCTPLKILVFNFHFFFFFSFDSFDFTVLWLLSQFPKQSTHDMLISSNFLSGIGLNFGSFCCLQFYLLIYKKKTNRIGKFTQSISCFEYVLCSLHFLGRNFRFYFRRISFFLSSVVCSDFRLCWKGWW